MLFSIKGHGSKSETRRQRCKIHAEQSVGRIDHLQFQRAAIGDICVPKPNLIKRLAVPFLITNQCSHVVTFVRPSWPNLRRLVEQFSLFPGNPSKSGRRLFFALQSNTQADRLTEAPSFTTTSYTFQGARSDRSFSLWFASSSLTNFSSLTS
jgi:hypothetical protein